MMIALLALYAAQPAPAEPPVDDITVIAERLRSVRVSPGVTIRKGVARQTSACKIKRSSGDAETAAVVCDAVRVCAARPQPSRKAFNACLEDVAIEAMIALRQTRAASAREAALDEGDDR